MTARHKALALATVLVVLSAVHGVAYAQDLEPRRWAHIPTGTNVAGVAYYYSDGNVFFDPVLEATDVEVESHGLAASYAHWFEMLGKTARVDVIVPYQSSRWTGTLSGEPATTQREGLADPWLRFSVNFVGAPPLKKEAFPAYSAEHPVTTVAGAALGVMLPLGEYKDEKLLNLGQNRFILRPQAGVVHTRGSWSYELTGSVFWFTDNNDFFGGNKLEQAPLYALQAHAVHTFPNRWWASLSGGFNWGGEATVNGVDKDDERRNVLSAASVGLPIGKAQAVKLVYFRGDAQVDAGQDSNSLILAWNVRF